MVTVTYEYFDYIYHRILRYVNDYGEHQGVTRKVEFKETLSASFCLTIPKNNTVNSVVRNTNMDYAKAFAEYCVNGGENLDELLRLNPKALRYVSDKNVHDGYKNYTVNYGERIAEQLPSVLKILSADPQSRRAVIQILKPEDGWIPLGKNVTLEYPCCISLQFFIRFGQLHMQVNMRSQNVALTIVYDVYNFTAVQHHVASLLNIPVGYYYHHMNSAHFFLKEQELVDEILLENSKQIKM